MPRRAKSVCRKTGCNVLLDVPGYCDKHKVENVPFKKQNEAKTSETKKFYQSYKWTMTSRSHRKKQPLCQDCLRKGKVTQGTEVHHHPELKELLSMGLNPFSEKYLETLCKSCHNGHLQAKR